MFFLFIPAYHSFMSWFRILKQISLYFGTLAKKSKNICFLDYIRKDFFIILLFYITYDLSLFFDYNLFALFISFI